MSTKTREIGSEERATRATEPSSAVASQQSARRPGDDEIASRAYTRYLARGGEHGHDLDDWLEAEREVSRELENEAEHRG
ncbi:MAG: DUF2934 domain-containing protein [Vicinamibacterales bacterium]